jgi:hypothetical protein
MQHTPRTKHVAPRQWRQSILYSEPVSGCCESQIKHVNALCGKNEEYF